MKVYVVTGLEMGWDCVVGVYTNISFRELEQQFPEEDYVITLMTVEETLT
jgi:hypothetical protein